MSRNKITISARPPYSLSPVCLPRAARPEQFRVCLEFKSSRGKNFDAFFELINCLIIRKTEIRFVDIWLKKDTVKNLIYIFVFFNEGFSKTK